VSGPDKLLDPDTLYGNWRLMLQRDSMVAVKQKNILYIESGPGLGGSAFSLYRVLKNLDRSKYNPYVFAYYEAPVFREIAALGVPVKMLPIYQPFPSQLVSDNTLVRRCRNYVALYGNLFIETLLNGMRLARFIKKLDIQVVHCNNGIFENFAAVVAARLANVPCVSDVKGTEPLLKIERLFSGWVKRAIVLNQAMFDHYSAVFGNHRVNLVFECIDLDSAKNPNTSKIRKEFAIRPRTFCIGTFARLIEGKGIPEFIKAAAKVIKIKENVQFFIVGDAASGNSDFEQRLRTLAHELGADQHITFTGWRSDVIDIMSAMNLVLQISTTFPEGMPLAPIEAMALRKPVVVSDIAGYTDIKIWAVMVNKKY
jgi:glycosyltransferase involved in cell wall biosynthesis